MNEFLLLALRAIASPLRSTLDAHLKIMPVSAFPPDYFITIDRQVRGSKTAVAHLFLWRNTQVANNLKITFDLRPKKPIFLWVKFSSNLVVKSGRLYLVSNFRSCRTILSQFPDSALQYYRIPFCKRNSRTFLKPDCAPGVDMHVRAHRSTMLNM